MKKLFFLFFFVSTFFSLSATHNRSGEILYKRIAPFTQVVGGITIQVYTYSITVIKYTDDGANIADRCVDTVRFGDGQKGVASRINGLTSCGCGTLNGTPIGCGVLIVNSTGYKVKQNIYSIVHTYPGPGSYTVRSFDPNRNAGVYNIPNSVNIPFYIESLISIDASLGPNSSPVLSNPPTDQGIVGGSVFINACAYDIDGDSLSYELTESRGGNGLPIAGYTYPDAGPGGSFGINPITGLLTWRSPQSLGEFNIAMIVREWRKSSCASPYQMIGYVMRDMQVIIVSGTSNTVSVGLIQDTCVKAGATITKSIMINTSGTLLKIFGETAALSNSASLSPDFLTTSQVSTFSWQTQCAQVRKKPYDIFIVSTPFGSGLNRKYNQFRVTVLPPSPVMAVPQVDTGFVELSWNSLSTCLPNLAGYNIYRKTGNSSWIPNACQQGVIAGSGFVSLGSVPPTTTTFTDNIYLYHDLVNGAKVQYMVTAYTDDCSESFADNAVVVTLVVGIKENELTSNTVVYPNPFKSKIEIDLGGSSYQNLESTVYSMDGKHVFYKENKNVSGKLEIALNELKPGIYILCIKTEKGSFYKKIVKD